ncbi:MAG: FkbM family methyltransferase [Planctomycetota bacterium]
MSINAARGAVVGSLPFSQPAWYFVQQFLQYPERRCLFGATAAAAAICSELPIAAILDDFCPESTFCGVPVKRVADAGAHSLVVCTQLGRPATAASALAVAGLTACDFFGFARYSGLRLPSIRFWSGFAEQTAAHLPELAWLRGQLADDESVEVLDRLVDFRLHDDVSALKGFTDRQAFQYFEEFLELRQDGESFADAGGYDGATTAQFLDVCPGAKRCWCFEPHPENRLRIQQRFSGDQRIEVVGCALGDRIGFAAMEGQGSVASISSAGTLEIPVRTLDSMKLPELTWLKMDIEGSELAAIKGSVQTIARCRPRLAICVYHLASDLWEIPRLVLNIDSRYAIFLRHYTEGVVETVMSFVPRKSAK